MKLFRNHTILVATYIYIIILLPERGASASLEKDINSISKEDLSKDIVNDKPTNNCEKQGFVTRYFNIPSQLSQTVEIDYNTMTSIKRYQKNEESNKDAKRRKLL